MRLDNIPMENNFGPCYALAHCMHVFHLGIRNEVVVDRLKGKVQFWNSELIVLRNGTERQHKARDMSALTVACTCVQFTSSLSTFSKTL